MRILITENQLRYIIEGDLDRVELSDVLSHYNRYGDLEGIDVPEIKRDKLSWLFNQILMIIDELKENHINSSEYTNTSNWGYKKSGELGLFDIGFGNYFEEFDKKPSEIDMNEESDTLNKIKGKLGLGKSKYIGSGVFGHAHDLGDGRILKLTKDKTEAINSNKVKGKELEHIANIYDVRQFMLNDNRFYVIILEKLKLDSKLDLMYKELENLFDSHRDLHIDPIVIEKIGVKHKVVGEFLKDMIKYGYEKTWEKWHDALMGNNDLTDKYDFNDISEISFWIKGSETNDHYIDDRPPDYIFDIISKLL